MGAVGRRYGSVHLPKWYFLAVSTLEYRGSQREAGVARVRMGETSMVGWYCVLQMVIVASLAVHWLGSSGCPQIRRGLGACLDYMYWREE